MESNLDFMDLISGLLEDSPQFAFDEYDDYTEGLLDSLEEGNTSNDLEETTRCFEELNATVPEMDDYSTSEIGFHNEIMIQEDPNMEVCEVPAETLAENLAKEEFEVYENCGEILGAENAGEQYEPDDNNFMDVENVAREVVITSEESEASEIMTFSTDQELYATVRNYEVAQGGEVQVKRKRPRRVPSCKPKPSSLNNSTNKESNEQEEIIRQTRCKTFIRQNIIFILRWDENHKHKLPDCHNHCVGFREESYIDILDYIPNNCVTSGNVIVSFANPSHDFKHLCCSDNQKNIYVFSIKTDMTWELHGLNSLKKPVLNAQFDRQLKRIVLSDRNGELSTFSIDLSLPNCINSARTAMFNMASVTHLILSQNGRQIFTAHRDGHIKISRFQDGVLEKILVVEGNYFGPFRYIALLKNDTILVAITENSDIIIWEYKPASNCWLQYGAITHLAIEGEGYHPIRCAHACLDPLAGRRIQIIVQYMDKRLGPLLVINPIQNLQNCQVKDKKEVLLDEAIVQSLTDSLDKNYSDWWSDDFYVEAFRLQYLSCKVTPFTTALVVDIFPASLKFFKN